MKAAKAPAQVMPERMDPQGTAPELPMAALSTLGNSSTILSVPLDPLPS